MGWSPSTTLRMSRRYGHIGQAAQREAVETLEGALANQKTPEFQCGVHHSVNHISEGQKPLTLID